MPSNPFEIISAAMSAPNVTIKGVPGAKNTFLAAWRRKFSRDKLSANTATPKWGSGVNYPTTPMTEADKGVLLHILTSRQDSTRSDNKKANEMDLVNKADLSHPEDQAALAKINKKMLGAWQKSGDKKIQALGKLLTAAANQGANSFGSLHYDRTNLGSTSEEKAYIKAVKQYEAKAQEVFKSLRNLLYHDNKEDLKQTIQKEPTLNSIKLQLESLTAEATKVHDEINKLHETGTPLTNAPLGTTLTQIDQRQEQLKKAADLIADSLSELQGAKVELNCELKDEDKAHLSESFQAAPPNAKVGIATITGFSKQAGNDFPQKVRREVDLSNIDAQTLLDLVRDIKDAKNLPDDDPRKAQLLQLQKTVKIEVTHDHNGKPSKVKFTATGVDAGAKLNAVVTEAKKCQAAKDSKKEVTTKVTADNPAVSASANAGEPAAAESGSGGGAASENSSTLPHATGAAVDSRTSEGEGEGATTRPPGMGH